MSSAEAVLAQVDSMSGEGAMVATYRRSKQLTCCRPVGLWPGRRFTTLECVEPRQDARSGRAALVAMMESTDFRDGHDGAVFRRRDRTRDRRIVVQRQMRTRSLMIRTIAGHQPAQTYFVEHDHVIKTLATSRSNKSLDEGILPRCPRAVSTSSIPIAFTVAPRASNA